jgi:hypothetical protein
MSRRYFGYEGGYGYRRGSGYRRRGRRREERTIEMASMGLIIVLFAITLLYPVKPEVIALIGGGIFLAAAVFQWQRRWRVNPMTWIGGLIMLIAGVLGLQGNGLPGGIFLPLGVFGLVIVASLLTGEF